MNCQDVVTTLDNFQPDQIDSRQRQQLNVHFSTCADCARIWHAQSTLATLPDLPMPEGLEAQCMVAVAGRFPTAVAGGWSRLGRGLVLGSFTALAAAAASLVLVSGHETRTAPAPGEPQATLRSDTEASVDRGAITVQSAPAEPTTQPGPMGTAVFRKPEAPGFTVQLVLPEPAPAEQKVLPSSGTDPAAQEVLQALRAALLAELRKLPGIGVVSDVPAQIAAPSRHYRLLLRPIQMVGVNGRPMRRERGHDMSLDVQEVQSGGSTIDHFLPRGSFAVDPLATCPSPDAAENMPCDAPTTATFLVRHLRQEVFPADVSVTQPLQARLRDFSLAPEVRFQAFVELFREQAKVGGKSLLSDPDVVRAAVELSQVTDAAHRAQLWRAMRGVVDASLVDPLLTSLLQDPEAVRVAAIETLAADFSGNLRARPALELAATSDRSLLIRALARRGLHGEAAWQNYVVTSLKDSTLPASQRVEAFLHELYAPDTIDGIPEGSPGNYWQILKGLDDGAVRALAEVFPKADQLRSWPGNNLVGNFASVHSQSPAVREMLLTVLEHDTRALNRSVAGEVLAQTRASEPRVRDALTRAARSDPDASVRDYLRQVLDRDYVKRSMAQSPN